MSCISLTLQMSMNSCRPLSEEDFDSTLETFDGVLIGSSSVPKASSGLKLDFVAGVSLTAGALFARRGSAKLEPPKPELDLELEPPSKLGCSSFGVCRGREYFGVVAFSKVEFALGSPGENPCPKLNELTPIAAVADSVVQTKMLRSEA